MVTMATLPEAFAVAVEHYRAGRFAAAEAVCQQILAMEPQHSRTLHLAGVIARDSGRNEIAVEFFTRAIGADESIAAFHYDLGGIHLGMRRFSDAALCYERALALNPDFADAHNNLGVVWSALGKPEDAIACFQRGLHLNPGNPAGYNNLGILLKNKGDLDQAAACYQEALQLQPDFVQAFNNLGNVLLEQGRPAEAIACCQRAIQLRPNFTDAHITLGNCLKDQGKLDEAVACYQRALTINANIPEAHNNLGSVLKDRGELDEAIACFQRAMQLQPDNATYHSNLVYTLYFHPCSTARTIFQEHQRWNHLHAERFAAGIEPHVNDRSPDRRLRIGYLSPDLRSHSVGRFLIPLLEEHDHTTFEIYCYSSSKKQDALTERFRSRSDVWRSVFGISNEEVAACIRRDGIDILIDLTMHMENNRLLIFARKPAPVQVTYLAYCGTTGLCTIDYRLTDPWLDPPGGDEAHYSEQSIRLPETYWCYQPIAPAHEPAPLPALTAGDVTFGCLNNFCKVTAPTLAAWAKILQTLPGARLLLHARPGSHRERLQRFFASQRVAPERLSFTDQVNAAEYFGLYEQIDVALDPFPYGGGTTTCDALWMGVPVVSLAGKTAVSRSGLSILTNLGLSQLVGFDPDQYVRIAVELAGDLPRLRDLRRSLRARMQASPLMDAPRFARNVEAAYREMWRRWCFNAATY